MIEPPSNHSSNANLLFWFCQVWEIPECCVWHKRSTFSVPLDSIEHKHAMTLVSCGCFPGHPLQRLLESASVHDGHAVWILLSDCGSGGSWSFPAPQWYHWDQTPQQHVHVPGQPGLQTNFLRHEVGETLDWVCGWIDKSICYLDYPCMEYEVIINNQQNNL